MMFWYYFDVFLKIFIFLYMFFIVMVFLDIKWLLKDLFKEYDNVIVLKIWYDEVMNVMVRFILRGIIDFNEVVG